MARANPAVAPRLTEIEIGTGRGTLKRVSWAAIFAGAVIALAITVMLGLLGMAIGFAVVDPMFDRNPVAGVPVGAAVFMVISQIIALAIGGYIAARLAGIPLTVSSGIHGASIWALATVMMVVLTSTSVGALVSGSAAVIGNMAQAAGTAAEAVIPDDASLPDIATPELDLSDLPPSVRQAMRRRGLTAETMRAEAREMYRAVISEREQRRIVETGRATAMDILRSPDDAIADVRAAIDDLFGKGGVLSAEDREQAIAVMRNRFGVTEREAEQILSRWEQAARNASAEIEQAYEAARQQSLEIAEATTDALAQGAFWAFLASALGLAAAVAGGVAGRPGRTLDEDTAAEAR